MNTKTWQDHELRKHIKKIHKILRHKSEEQLTELFQSVKKDTPKIKGCIKNVCSTCTICKTLGKTPTRPRTDGPNQTGHPKDDNENGHIPAKEDIEGTKEDGKNDSKKHADAKNFQPKCIYRAKEKERRNMQQHNANDRLRERRNQNNENKKHNRIEVDMANRET